MQHGQEVDAVKDIEAKEPQLSVVPNLAADISSASDYCRTRVMIVAGTHFGNSSLKESHTVQNLIESECHVTH